MKAEFVNMDERRETCETTASIVGVDRGDTQFKKVSINPKETDNLFFSQFHQLLLTHFMGQMCRMKPMMNTLIIKRLSKTTSTD
jgi:hypothetical protein